MERCGRNIEDLDKHIKKLKESSSERLQQEYERLVDNLKKVEEERSIDKAWANPVLPNAILEEAVPGTIRTAEHFIIFMRRFMEYVKHRMRTRFVQIESPAAFLRDIKSRVFIDRKPMR